MSQATGPPKPVADGAGRIKGRLRLAAVDQHVLIVAGGERLRYRVLRIRKRNTPPGCSDDSTSSQPVVLQKCSKSLTAPGSVASTSRTAPAASGFSARRAFSTGSGHNSPVASRVTAGS